MSQSEWHLAVERIDQANGHLNIFSSTVGCCDVQHERRVGLKIQIVAVDHRQVPGPPIQSERWVQRLYRTLNVGVRGCSGR